MGKIKNNISNEELKAMNDIALVKLLDIDKNLKDIIYYILFQRYNPLLQSFCNRLNCPSSIIKDLIQESWYKFIIYPKKGQIINLLNFLKCSIKLSLKEDLRKNKEDTSLKENNKNIEEYENNEKLYEIFENEDLDEQILELSKKFTDNIGIKLLILKHIDGLSIKEIKEITSIKEWAIRKRLSRTIEKVHNYLIKNNNKYLLW